MERLLEVNQTNTSQPVPVDGTRGRGEVLGQAGVAEACANTLKGVIKEPKK